MGSGKEKGVIRIVEKNDKYGNTYVTDIELARKAAREGKNLMVIFSYVKNSGKSSGFFLVTDVHEDDDGTISGADEEGDVWEAKEKIEEEAEEEGEQLKTYFLVVDEESTCFAKGRWQYKPKRVQIFESFYEANCEAKDLFYSYHGFEEGEHHIYVGFIQTYDAVNEKNLPKLEDVCIVKTAFDSRLYKRMVEADEAQRDIDEVVAKAAEDTFGTDDEKTFYIDVQGRIYENDHKTEIPEDAYFLTTIKSNVLIHPNGYEDNLNSEDGVEISGDAISAGFTLGEEVFMDMTEPFTIEVDENNIFVE